MGEGLDEVIASVPVKRVASPQRIDSRTARIDVGHGKSNPQHDRRN
jgi:hypothetical protein